jgi:hypothetical protein
MDEKLPNLLINLADKFISYMPDLLGGLILVILGWFLGWFTKRVVIQLSIILRLERFLISFRWGKGFSRGDVRYGFYNFLGSIAFFIIFLIFLNNAFSTWRLTILSDLLGKGILFLPRIMISLIVFGVGWFLSSWSAQAAYKSLHREEIPRATLIANFIKAVLLLFFSAIALVELNIAREVVIIGFATIMITLGILTIVITAFGGKDFIQKIEKTLEEE